MAGLLAQIVGQAESGNNPHASATDYLGNVSTNIQYQQSAGYIAQYGAGEAGINNQAQQLLAQNPNATLGDFYALYNSGGAYSWAGLGASRFSANVTNFTNAASMYGQSPSTPLASVLGGSSGSTIATGPADQTSGANPNTTDPLGSSVTMNPSGTATTSAAAQGTQIQTALQPEETSFITSTVNSIESAMGGGLTKTLTAVETAVATYLGGLQNWFIRGAVIMLGVVLIAIALVVILWDHGGQRVAQQAVRVAAA